MSELKSFQVGIYSFERKITITNDDRAMDHGTIVACFYPLGGPEGLCFGIDQQTGKCKILTRQNLNLESVITLMYEAEYLIPEFRQMINDTWAKLNAMVRELRERKQSIPPLHQHKNVHDEAINLQEELGEDRQSFQTRSQQ